LISFVCLSTVELTNIRSNSLVKFPSLNFFEARKTAEYCGSDSAFQMYVRDISLCLPADCRNSITMYVCHRSFACCVGVCLDVRRVCPFIRFHNLHTQMLCCETQWTVFLLRCISKNWPGKFGDKLVES